MVFVSSGVLAKLVEQAWEMGETSIHLIHAMVAIGISPGFDTIPDISC